MSVKSDYQQEFDELRSAIFSRRETLTYTPKQGDLVFFDNWRLLHARKAVGGRHLRFHNRMWIDLATRHQGNYLLGVRGFGAGELATVERNNAEGGPPPLGPVYQSIVSDRTAWEAVVQQLVKLAPLASKPQGFRKNDGFCVESVTVKTVEFRCPTSKTTLSLPFEALSQPRGGTGSGWQAEIRRGRLAFDKRVREWAWRQT